jgi:hypothetical protein
MALALLQHTSADDLQAEVRSHTAVLQEIGMNVSDDPRQRSTVPAQRARQGVTGHNVRYVLGFALAGVIIAFGIIWFIYFA